ncbi:DNA/RNA polymerase [Piromyces finnis]|uniref:DNA polymerase kappa n=1 Tax=Piromyces finnis TaxID=1754191 RepID=A0A1Y1VGC6_9FUNG|nr:DNA/RNA polymerase [Piromyces finnis]|eukprot:ORX55477.1 DNA/RNA polymerase [Piromyces finnis]
MDNNNNNKNINNNESNNNKDNLCDIDDKNKIDDENVLYRLSLNPNKGGLQNVDKEKINKIIYEVSKGSAFFKNAKEKEKAHFEKIKEIKKKYLFLKNQPMEYEKQQMKNIMNKMESDRDLSQYIVHVDMDAFYASVEELDNPELKNKPMAVGSKSMLSTANYEARKYGVRSAMPGYIALKLCKNLIIVPTRFERYHELSHQIRNIIANYDPDYCPASIDEVYLNITNFLNDNPNYTPSKVTEELREEIYKQTRLTASAGIAPNICSDMNKPNGQTELKNCTDEILKFLKDLPIGKVSGIGKVAEKTLNELGIKTCGELKENMVYIKELFKPSSYQFLLSASLGLGRTKIENKWKRKSISVERTFSNTSEIQKLEDKLHEISCKLANDVKKENLKGKSVTLKLKTSSFEILTRCLTISKYIYQQEDLYKVGKKVKFIYIIFF